VFDVCVCVCLMCVCVRVRCMYVCSCVCMCVCVARKAAHVCGVLDVRVAMHMAVNVSHIKVTFTVSRKSEPHP